MKQLQTLAASTLLAAEGKVGAGEAVSVLSSSE